MGNTFGPKGFLIGSRRHVSSSKYRAGSVADEEARADLINALAPYLPDIDEAVAATERVDNAWTRQENVAALIGRQEHRVASQPFAMVISSARQDDERQL
jgi:hypothetical protein